MLVETLLVIPFTFNLLFHTKCNKSNIVPTQAVTFNGDCCRPLLSNRHRDVHCLVFPARFRGQRSTKFLFALERRTEEKFVPLRGKHVRKQQRGRKWNGRERVKKKQVSGITKTNSTKQHFNLKTSNRTIQDGSLWMATSPPAAASAIRRHNYCQTFEPQSSDLQPLPGAHFNCFRAPAL